MNTEQKTHVVNLLERTLIKAEYAKLKDVYTQSGELALIAYLEAKWKQYGLTGEKPVTVIRLQK